MANKKPGFVDTIKATAKDIFERNLISTVQGQIRAYFDKMEAKVRNAIQDAIKGVFMLFLAIVGLIFLMLSAVFYLIEVQEMSKTTSFFIVGVILILLTVVLRYVLFAQTKR